MGLRRRAFARERRLVGIDGAQGVALLGAQAVELAAVVGDLAHATALLLQLIQDYQRAIEFAPAQFAAQPAGAEPSRGTGVFIRAVEAGALGRDQLRRLLAQRCLALRARRMAGEADRRLVIIGPLVL